MFISKGGTEMKRPTSNFGMKFNFLLRWNGHWTTIFCTYLIPTFLYNSRDSLPPWSYSVFPNALNLRIIKCKTRIFCYVHYQWHPCQSIKRFESTRKRNYRLFTNFCIVITPAICDVKEIGLNSFVLTSSPDFSVQFPRFLTLRSYAVLIIGRCMRLCLFSNVWATKNEISKYQNTQLQAILPFCIFLTPAMEWKLVANCLHLL